MSKNPPRAGVSSPQDRAPGSRHTFLSLQDKALFDMSLSATPTQPHLAGLHLSRLRCWSLDRGGHHRWCHLLLLRLLGPRQPKGCQGVDPIPKRRSDRSDGLWMPSDTQPYLLKKFFFLFFSHLTSSRNLSSSRAGDWEYLGEKKRRWKERSKTAGSTIPRERTVDRNLHTGVTDLSLSEPLS